MNKDIYLTNSLGNEKEKFIPNNLNRIGMYVCGPTVYDDPHIGNARPLVIFDILFKLLKLKFSDKSVTYVRNITDVDDKIIKSSKENKISITFSLPALARKRGKAESEDPPWSASSEKASQELLGSRAWRRQSRQPL